MKQSIKDRMKLIEEKYNVTYQEYDSSTLQNIFKEKLLSQFFDHSKLEERFQIPDAYLDFITSVSNISDKKGDWISIYGGDSSYDGSEDLFRFHCIKKNELKLIMINIGYWSDKHEYWLSCDKANSFGKIFDSYDMCLDYLEESNAEDVYENLEHLLDELISRY